MRPGRLVCFFAQWELEKVPWKHQETQIFLLSPTESRGCTCAVLCFAWVRIPMAVNMCREAGSETMPCLYLRRRSYSSYNLPVTNISVLNLTCISLSAYTMAGISGHFSPSLFKSWLAFQVHQLYLHPCKCWFVIWKSLPDCLSCTSAFLLAFSLQSNPPLHWPRFWEEEGEMLLLSPG